MIHGNTPCRVYADIEWEGDRDDTHAVVRRVMAAVQAYCMEKHGRKPKLCVGCSTRPIDAQNRRWKNSYHLVVPDIAFENYHDGAMEKFWDDIRDRLCSLKGDEWHWNNKGKQTHIIDSTVYTRNRLMRLMLCSKRGSVPFARINGDPLDEHDTLTSAYAEDDPEAWRPFFVSDANALHADTQTAGGADVILSLIHI